MLHNNMDAAEYKHPDLKVDYLIGNGSMSSNQSNEGDIRQSPIEAYVVCRVPVQCSRVVRAKTLR